jgi:ATP-dependent helicase/nuclease subunit B
LTAAERGNLVHVTLARFWRGAHTHDALRACTPQELAARVDDAAAAAPGTLSAARRALLAPVVVAGESMRLRDLALRWLNDCEYDRPAFTVESIETDMTIELAGLVLSLRLDRVDRPATGGALIIDYKTGPVAVPRNWVRERPQATQLGLYALAWPEHAPTLPVRGVAYAQLAADRVRAVGVSADDEAWPALTDVANATGLPRWSDLDSWWRTHLEGLADEFRRGHAAVAPRDRFAPCRQCGRHALCRIGAARDDDEDVG